MVGNTKNQPPVEKEKTVIRTRAWFFTLNNPKKHGFISEKQMLELFKGLNPQQLMMQLERGEGNGFGEEKTMTEGTEHYQGCVYFGVQIVFETMKQLCGKIHWEKCRNWKRCIEYCRKSETRVDGPWSIGIAQLVAPLPPMTGWQLEVLKILDRDPEPRKLYWFWEAKGNAGKSHMCAWLTDNRDSITVSGSCKDVSYILTERETFPRIVVIDIPRSNDKQIISYQLIEQLKSSQICSTKYKGKSIRFNIPHVIVFANVEPNLNEVSLDRWEIFWINKKKSTLLRKNIEIHEESSEEEPEGYS